ncbi:GNAT family N-acetyltransferase [Seohaeicola zhoushanensis]
MSHEVRAMTPEDIPAACVLLNQIISLGGTTALEQLFDEVGLEDYLLGPSTILCHVVLDGAGAVAGFQHLGRRDDLPEGWADIASFTRRDDPLRGAGRALFAETLARAKELGIVAINATIRADNVPGLGFYRRMGFVQYDVSRGSRCRMAARSTGCITGSI